MPLFGAIMSAKEERLPPQDLHLVLSYDVATGLLTWLPRCMATHGRMFPASTESTFKHFNSCYAGKTALNCTSAQGYKIGSIGAPFLAHRVIWAMVHGEWPSDQIDHINGVRTDNRVQNLRAVTRKENGKNCSPNKNGTSRFLGVSWSKDRKKWIACIMSDGKQTNIGAFSSEVDAAIARDAVAARLHGQYARLNFGGI